MAFGVLLRQQWISGYIEFVPDWSKLPVDVNVSVNSARAFNLNWNISAVSNVTIDATKALNSYENASAVSTVAIDATKVFNSSEDASAVSNVAIDASRDVSSAGKRSVLSNIAFDRTFLSGPGSGITDAYGVTDLFRVLTASNNVQAAIALLTALSKTMVTDQHGAVNITLGTDLQYTIAVTPSLVPQPPLFKNLSVVNAECPDLLEIEPSDVLVESGEFEQTTMETDSGSRYIITSRPTPKYYIILQWRGLKQNDAENVISVYLTTTKAFGRARSFKWKHPIDDVIYVVRFADDLTTDRRVEITNRESIRPIRLEILGRSAD